MNRSKADAIAQLSKWYSAATKVRAMYRSVSGNILIIGKMSELTPSTVKIQGNSCELVLYLRDTSQYEYHDAQQSLTEVQKEQPNRYPIFISVKFSGGDHLEVSEFFTNGEAIDPH